MFPIGVEVWLYGSKQTSLAFENYLAKVLVRSIPGIQRKDKGSALVPCHTKTRSPVRSDFRRKLDWYFLLDYLCL
jgi:hypothetical protein